MKARELTLVTEPTQGKLLHRSTICKTSPSQIDARVNIGLYRTMDLIIQTSKADAAALRAAIQLVGLAVISLNNCWRLTGCNDVATHINITEHYSIYYTKNCSVCCVVQLYKSTLKYSIQLAWNLAMSFDERCSRG